MWFQPAGIVPRVIAAPLSSFRRLFSSPETDMYEMDRQCSTYHFWLAWIYDSQLSNSPSLAQGAPYTAATPVTQLRNVTHRNADLAHQTDAMP